MKKEFVEYQNERGTIPYPASTLCFRLTKYAQEYILSDRKNISNIDTNVRDAVLTDAINYLGAQGYCDFGLYTKDLYKSEEHTFYVEPDCLITAAFRRFSYYMFNYDMVESVLRNNHMNECREEFDVNDGLTVLLDFVNFITEKNDYDRVFTLNDFYESAKKQEQSFKLRQLKYFLEHTSKYSERLQNQENIDDIFEEMAKNNDLKYISNNGSYYYTDEIRDQIGQAKMDSYEKNKVEKEIYAMAYAYYKANTNNTPKTKIIVKKINEMKGE